MNKMYYRYFYIMLCSITALYSMQYKQQPENTSVSCSYEQYHELIQKTVREDSKRADTFIDQHPILKKRSFNTEQRAFIRYLLLSLHAISEIVTFAQDNQYANETTFPSEQTYEKRIEMLAHMLHNRHDGNIYNTSDYNIAHSIGSAFKNQKSAKALPTTDPHLTLLLLTEQPDLFFPN